MANDPDGRIMIGAAVGAQVLGNFFIKRIIAIKV
jgi:Flp pilus assembly protein TadB